MTFHPQQVRRRLQGLTMQPRQEWRDDRLKGKDGFTEAAVLIPLTEVGEEMHVVLTKRSARLREHSGEVSFPGGRRDPGDETLLQTALRESYEEIALHPDDVDVYGAFIRLPTVTGYRVTAYVGEFPHPYELGRNPREIEVVFSAPLAALRQDEVHYVEEREFMGRVYPIHFFDYGGHTIWGATGFMLHLLLEYLDPEH